MVVGSNQTGELFTFKNIMPHTGFDMQILVISSAIQYKRNRAQGILKLYSLCLFNNVTENAPEKIK